MNSIDVDLLRELRVRGNDRLLLAQLMASPRRTPGLSATELRSYSIGRAITGDGTLERDAHGAVLESLPAELRNLVPTSGYRLIPPEVLARTMVSTPGSAGGYAIGNQMLGFIDGLYARSITARLGATILSGLSSNATFGRQSGSTTAHWQADGTSVSAGDQSLGQVSLTPKTLIAITDCSEQVLVQTGQAAQAFIMGDLGKVIAAAVDRAALRGAGGPQPLGVANTAGIASLDTETATLAKIDTLVGAVGDASALNESGGFASNTHGAQLLQARAEFGTAWPPLWTGSAIDGRMRGFNATSTENFADGELLFGSWNHLVLADFGTLALAVDRSGGFNSGTVSIRALWLVDVAVRQASAFAFSSNLS